MSNMNDMVDVEILLVEDNPDDAEITIRALKSRNIANSLRWLKDGAEALDYLLQEGSYQDRRPGNPRIILLDLKMPKIDGLEVVRRVRAEPRTRTIPIVMLTSSREESDIVRSYELGVNSYIVKPVDFDKFAAALSTFSVYWLVVNQPPI